MCYRPSAVHLARDLVSIEIRFDAERSSLEEDPKEVVAGEEHVKSHEQLGRLWREVQWLKQEI